MDILNSICLFDIQQEILLISFVCQKFKTEMWATERNLRLIGMFHKLGTREIE